jgi:hypothetical protein
LTYVLIAKLLSSRWGTGAAAPATVRFVLRRVQPLFEEAGVKISGMFIVLDQFLAAG